MSTSTRADDEQSESQADYERFVDREIALVRARYTTHGLRVRTSMR